MNTATKDKFYLALRSLFIIALITALLAELSIRFLIHIKLLSLDDYRRERFWEDRFIEDYEHGVFVYHKIHQSDPVLGWSLKPNTSEKSDNDNYTINAQGFRSLEDFQYKPDKFNIITIGDSFTFGDDIDDKYVWPTLLKNQNAAFNVINLGVTAYGIDQMYITLSQNIQKYHPNLVILAFIGDDLGRSQLKFRDFKKPLFVLTNGTLQLTNVPIGNADEVYKEVKLRHQSLDEPSHSALISSIRYMITQVNYNRQVKDRMSSDYRVALNEALFNEIEKTAHQSGSQLLVVTLPIVDEVWKQKRQPYGYRVAQAWVDKSSQRSLLNMGDVYIAGTNFFQDNGHYRKEENIVLVKSVSNKIYTLNAWKEYQKHSQNLRVKSPQ